MGKILLGGMGIGLTLALATSVMAVDWSTTGYIYVGSAYYKNISNGTGLPLPTNAGWNQDNFWLQMRLRALLTARASDDLYGVFYIESDSTRWGEAEVTSNPSGTIGKWNADAVAVEVKNLYIDFRVPPKLPIWIRAGIQGIKIRDNVFISNDGAGITARIKIDPINLNINPMYMKRWEGQDFTEADDRDIYAVDVNMPAGPVKFGTYFLWDEARHWPTIADNGHLWWLGAYSDGKIGPVQYNFDFSYSGGRIDYAATPDVEYKGWLIRAVASYTQNRLTVGAGGWYSSGNDVRTNDFEGFALIEGRSEAPGAPNDDTLILMGDWFGTGGMTTAPSFVGTYGNYGVAGITAPATGSQFGGFWYVRAFTSYQLFSWLKLGFQVAYIGDTTKHGDTFGTARKAPFGATDLDDDSGIGWEFDIGANITIYRNLTYNLGFGYLVAGGALDQWNASSGRNNRPHDPWAFITRLAYTF
jgi:hypothetical protein